MKNLMPGQEPLFDMPSQENATAADVAIVSNSKLASEWQLELTTDCLCVMGLAGIHHVKGDGCNESPVAEEPTLEEVTEIVEESRGRGRPPKLDNELVDPVSAGRKRAAAKAPIAKGATCEWAYLKFAGGGVKPIVGCPGYPASDLHHGPDKSTLNNSRPEDVGVGEPFNLHKVCDYCHSRWHYANDPFYGLGGADDRPKDNSAWIPLMPYKEHDPNTREDRKVVFEIEAKRAKEDKNSKFGIS